MDQDTIESTRLARKLTYSPYISAKGITGTRNLMGHIWPSHAEEPAQCPDGTTPGMPDHLGAHTYCVPCANPKLSRDGLCDNVRAMEVALQDMDDSFNNPSRMRLGAEAVFVADTSYLNFYTREKIVEDCMTCAALCLDVPPEQINTHLFTLPELMNASHSANTTTYCTKCALYCADLSGCASLCVPLEYQLLIILASFLAMIIPLTICFCLFFKPQRVILENSKYTGTMRCPVNSEHTVPEDAAYCPTCGADVNSMFPEPAAPNRLQYVNNKQE
jgi:hypothetical protein